MMKQTPATVTRTPHGRRGTTADPIRLSRRMLFPVPSTCLPSSGRGSLGTGVEQHRAWSGLVWVEVPKSAGIAYVGSNPTLATSSEMASDQGWSPQRPSGDAARPDQHWERRSVAPIVDTGRPMPVPHHRGFV